MITSKKEHNSYLEGLGANERAIIEKIPVEFLRKIVATIVRFKLKFQFSGWLQYLLPVLFVLLFYFTGAITQLFALNYISSVLYALGHILILIVVFDIITIKYRIRFPEPLPKRKNVNIFDLMRERRSCRSFQTKKITETDLKEIMGSISLHSGKHSAGNNSIRFEYLHSKLTVWPVVNASEFIVAIAPKEYDRANIIEVGRILQKIVLDITQMGLGTCWIGPGADQKSIIESLGNRFDIDKDQVVCLCAIGYKSRYIPLFLRIFNAATHRRLAITKLFYTDKDLKRPVEMTGKELTLLKRNFEVCQWAPSSFNGQTTRAVVNLDENRNLTSIAFYTITTSRYYAPIAVGIWCTNWELGCRELGIKGYFKMEKNKLKNDDDKSISDVSWIKE